MNLVGRLGRNVGGLGLLMAEWGGWWEGRGNGGRGKAGGERESMVQGL